MLELFRHAGWVAWPLGFCSILALAIFLERVFTLMRLKQMEERAFMVLQLAQEKDVEAMLRDPQVVGAPITQIMSNVTSLRGSAYEYLQQSADVGLSEQRLRLRRYLSTLATIGSTAPFIGLFGTVLGVLAAFQQISQSNNMEGTVVAGGISEALSATAVGLLVAIPSVIAYNYLLGRVQAQMLHIQGHVARLMPLLESSPNAGAILAHSKREV